MTAHESRLDTLENDAEALRVLETLAEAGADLGEDAPGEESLRRRVAAAYQDGAATSEPEALLAWVRQRLAETENTIAALDGSGPPLEAAEGFRYLRGEIAGVMESHDLEESDRALLEAALRVLTP